MYPVGGGGDFLVSSKKKDVFWGQELLLEASDLLFHQKALAWCQGVGLVSNSVTFCATAAS